MHFPVTIAGVLVDDIHHTIEGIKYERYEYFRRKNILYQLITNENDPLNWRNDPTYNGLKGN